MRLALVSIGLVSIFAAAAHGITPSGPSTCSVELTSMAPDDFATAQGGSGPEARTEGVLGPVYMYGRLLKKPYVFSDAGGDTLFLNGAPYWPIRGPLTPSQRWPELAKRFREKAKSEEAKAELAYDKQAWETVKSMHDSGAPYEECLDSLAAIYDRSPFVVRTSVRKLTNGILFRRTDGNEATIGLGFEHAPPYNRDAHHAQMMRDFWRTVNAGGMIARGHVNGLSYFLTTPKSQLEKTNRLLKRLAAGDTLTREDAINTPLTNKAFRIQMSKPKAEPKRRAE